MVSLDKDHLAIVILPKLYRFVMTGRREPNYPAMRLEVTTLPGQDEVKKKVIAQVPQGAAAVVFRPIEELVRSAVESRALRGGDRAPDSVRLSRAWCPNGQTTFADLSKILSDMSSRGAPLVAVCRRHATTLSTFQAPSALNRGKRHTWTLFISRRTSVLGGTLCWPR
jgi:hypothetical protein